MDNQLYHFFILDNNGCHMVTFMTSIQKRKKRSICASAFVLIWSNRSGLLDSGQHVALHDPDPEPGVIGLINTKMSPMTVARIASEDARAICMREYGSSPDVDIYGDPGFTFP